MKLKCKLLASALTILNLMVVAPLLAQSQKWDTQFVPDDTFFSVSLNVSNLVNYEKEDSELRKFVEKGFRDNSSFDINEMQQLQMYFSGELQEGDSFGRDGDDMMAIKFVFSKPQKMQAIAEKMIGENLEDREHNGKNYWGPDNEYQPSVFAPTARIMVVGKEDAIKRLMEHDQSMGDVIERIKSADGNADMFLTFVNNDITKEIVAEIAQELDGIPFDLEDIAAEAKHGSLTVNLSAGKPIIGSIVTKDEAGAERLQRAADALVALGKTFIPIGKKELEKEQEGFPGNEVFKEYMEEQRKLGRQALDISEAVLEGTSTKATGNNVEIEVVVMGGIPQTVQVVGGMIQASMKMMEAFQAEQILEAEEAVEDIEAEIPQEE